MKGREETIETIETIEAREAREAREEARKARAGLGLRAASSLRGWSLGR
jgi:hypothetical protein